jgi:AcrR family transcriptional regulator
MPADARERKRIASPSGAVRRLATIAPSPGASVPKATRRADAERNRERILAAARSAFAEPGAQPSMAEISRRAGVGMATLYRNFPGRRELLEALYGEEVDAICAAAGNLGEEAPGERVTAWVRRFLAFSAGKRELASELLTHVDSGNPVFNESRARVLASGRPLLVAAQRAGEIRGDLTLEQILDMTLAIASIHGDPAYREPILRAALDGLRPAGGRSPA